MAFDPVLTGATANDGTGDPLRTAFTRINDNFDLAVEGAASSTDGTVVQFDGTTGKVVKASSVPVADIIVEGDARLTDSRTPTAHGNEAHTSTFVDAAGAAAAAPVQSVNTLTGAVVLDAVAVGADPTGTAASEVSTHNSDTTSVHGIADTATLVVGPASATDDSVALFDQTTGKLLKEITKANLAADTAFSGAYLAGQYSTTPAVGDLLEVQSVTPLVLQPRSREDVVLDVLDMVLIVDTLATGASKTVTLAPAGTVSIDVSWGDGTTEAYTAAGNITHTYVNDGVYEVRISGTLTAFADAGAINTNQRAGIVGVKSFGRLGTTSFSHALRSTRCGAFLPKTLPPGVTILANALRLMGNITSDITQWNTSRVTSFSSMFNQTAINQNISAWNTRSATTMSLMFIGASGNPSIGNWDVGNVTTFAEMFNNNGAFSQNLGGWRPSKATTMSVMFSGTALGTANYDALLTGWTDFTGTGWRNGAITAFADAGGGQVTVTTATAHGYANGHVMRITDTTNYNGSYVISNVAATSFRITAAFVATETGTWNATLQSNVTFGAGLNQYSAGAATTARGVLTGAPYNWTITDGGQV
jgi:surface protein